LSPNWIPGEAFTAANGLATGNGRPVRDRVAERYAAAITALHTEKEFRNAVL
jgi:hypothetical protein